VWSSTDRKLSPNVIMRRARCSSFARALCRYLQLLLLLCTIDSTDFYARACVCMCVHPAATLLLGIYLLENYRGDRCSKRAHERNREGKRDKLHADESRWFCFFQGWARGHVMYKGAKLRTWGVSPPSAYTRL